MIVEAEYRDGGGELRRAPQSTVDAVRAIVGDEAEVTDEQPGDAVGAPVCVLPAARQRALAVQVYSLWSQDGGGIGDLGDLAALARSAPYELLLLNPLHAALPGLPQEPSPYFPSSRQFRNPLYLGVDGVRASTADERVDRNAVWTAKMAALEREWGRFAGDARFDAYRAEQGDELATYASFCALTEQFGRAWATWPSRYRRPGVDVRAFAVGHADRVRFHEWLQWRLDEQVAAAAAGGTGLVNDVAVGFDPAGADAWRWQDVIAPGMHIGAPPDAFNPDGQDWGVPPFAPAALARSGYAPIVGALRAAFRHAAGIRIDHVMGLFRLFWIPEGGTPADGVYVRYPSAAMLDLVAHESQRAGAFVVGEDLGTVQAEVRAELARRRVLSYKLLWFEDSPPEQWPEAALAAVSTHDLPTIAGVWSGADGSVEMRQRLVANGAVPGTGAGDVVERVHASLARAPSLVVAHQVEDVLGMAERVNRPGTVDPANWSRRLPVDVDGLTERLQASAHVRS